jgi:hypothetical protein
MAKSRRMRRPGHVAPMETTKNACSLLVGKPGRKGPIGSPRLRWVDNVKMALREMTKSE